MASLFTGSAVGLGGYSARGGVKQTTPVVVSGFAPWEWQSIAGLPAQYQPADFEDTTLSYIDGGPVRVVYKSAVDTVVVYDVDIDAGTAALVYTFTIPNAAALLQFRLSICYNARYLGVAWVDDTYTYRTSTYDLLNSVFLIPETLLATSLIASTEIGIKTPISGYTAVMFNGSYRTMGTNYVNVAWATYNGSTYDISQMGQPSGTQVYTAGTTNTSIVDFKVTYNNVPANDTTKNVAFINYQISPTYDGYFFRSIVTLDGGLSWLPYACNVNDSGDSCQIMPSGAYQTIISNVGTYTRCGFLHETNTTSPTDLLWTGVYPEGILGPPLLQQKALTTKGYIVEKTGNDLKITRRNSTSFGRLPIDGTWTAGNTLIDFFLTNSLHPGGNSSVVGLYSRWLDGTNTAEFGQLDLINARARVVRYSFLNNKFITNAETVFDHIGGVTGVGGYSASGTLESASGGGLNRITSVVLTNALISLTNPDPSKFVVVNRTPNAVTNAIPVVAGAIFQTNNPPDNGLSGLITNAFLDITGGAFSNFALRQLSATLQNALPVVSAALTSETWSLEVNAEYLNYTALVSGAYFPLRSIVIRASKLNALDPSRVGRTVTLSFPILPALFDLIYAGGPLPIEIRTTRVIAGIQSSTVVALGVFQITNADESLGVVGTIDSPIYPTATKEISGFKAITYSRNSARFPMDLSINPADQVTGLGYPRTVSSVTHYLYPGSAALTEVFF